MRRQNVIRRRQGLGHVSRRCPRIRLRRQIPPPPVIRRNLSGAIRIPYLTVGRFHVPQVSGGVHQRRPSHHGAEFLAERDQKRFLLRQYHRFFYIIFCRIRCQLAQTNILQQADPKAAAVIPTPQRHHRHPHVKRVAGRPPAGVRKGIQGNIHIAVFF